MKNKSVYVCSSCGYESAKWAGKCSQCNEWNTFKEQLFIKHTKQTSNFDAKNNVSGKRIKDVVCDKSKRIYTGISEFDRVVGGGLVRDSVTILSAPPGAGKSTLSIMVADKLQSKGLTTLYASGEESASQIKSRINRLGLKNLDDMLIIDNGNMDFVIDEVIKYDVDFIILDSIQTFYLNEYLPSRAGNATQVMECASAICDLAKRNDRPRMVFAVGQTVKNDDDLAGSRGLEHLVDTYIRIDGDRDDTLRVLYAVKNRFGNTGETGFFNMTEKGLESVDNPSEYFMTERTTPAVGTSFTTIKDGSRAIILEIESIVSKSFTTYPSRIAETLKRDQLNILISILEQRANLNFSDKNVIVKSLGGIKLSDPSNNLAILMAITSSYKDTPIPISTAFIADVGLTGELKRVPNTEIRIRELERMGYKKVYIAPGSIKNQKHENIIITETKTIRDVIVDVFSQN